MPGPVAPYVTHAPVGAAAAAPSATAANALDVQRIRNVIERVDAAKGVADWNGRYAIDDRFVGTLPEGYQQMVAAAVARANTDPLVAANRTARPQAAAAAAPAAADWGQKIQDVGEKLGKTVDVINHVKTLFGGATAATSWWGVTVTLTHDAADALVALVRADVNAFLAVLVPFVPQAAAVLAVTTPAGLALGAWITAANTDKGVKVELLVWVVPWVEAVR
jgi:hypothetical protein